MDFGMDFGMGPKWLADRTVTGKIILGSNRRSTPKFGATGRNRIEGIECGG